MEYNEYAFSKDPKKLKTMEAKSGNKRLGQLAHMDASDVMKINKLYACKPSKKCKVCFICLIISRDGPSLASTDQNASPLNPSAVSLAYYNNSSTIPEISAGPTVRPQYVLKWNLSTRQV